MAKERRFKSKRDNRPPTPFVIEFEVERLEERKVEDSDFEGGYRVEHVPTGEWITEERTLHYTHRFPGQIGLDIQGMPTDPYASNRQKEAIEELLRRVIVEQELFWELMRSDRYVIDGGLINDLINSIIEDSSEVPTETPGT